MRWYKLVDKVPVEVSFTEYVKEDFNDRVIKQENINSSFVSTVFLSLDHSFGGNKPLLFETMIFNGEHDGYQDRYCTYEEAEIGHQKAVNLVKSIIDESE